MRKKIIRITTVPISLEKLLENQLRFMQQFYDVIAVSSDASRLKKVGDLQNVSVFPIEMTRKITPLKDVIAVWQLYRFLKKEKPFIVHTHTPKAGTLGMIAARLAGVPHRFHTIAGLPLLEAKGNKRRLLDFVEKITYAAATMIYPNSFGLKEIIIQEKFCKHEKLKVIGNGSSNGINIDVFNSDLFSISDNDNLKSKLGLKPDDFVFVFVGRLVGDKGINELVAAFQKLLDLHPRVKLLLVGGLEGDLDPLKEETLNQINLNPNIIAVGHQNDVRPYFAIAQALVFPSYREGFPNVVMQAGAMGLPSIVSNINGCNEIIVDGENGIIIPVKESNAIYLAMKKIYEDAIFRNYLRDNSRPMIAAKYQQEVVWEAILSEYKKLEHGV